MDKIHIKCNYKKQVLSILPIAVLALGVLSIGFSFEDASAFHKPQKVKAKVKDATTLDPIKNATCEFVFGSGDTASDSTNNGGVAKVKDPDPDSDETTVEVTCTDGTNSATANGNVKKHGTTVIKLFISTTTTTTTTATTETTTTTITTTTTGETTTTETTTETTTTETTTETTTTTT
ncbi:MAG: hypothetical protein ACRD5H_05360 [Nitrososphaerales archaeon]